MDQYNQLIQNPCLTVLKSDIKKKPNLIIFKLAYLLPRGLIYTQAFIFIYIYFLLTKVVIKLSTDCQVYQ